MISFVILHYKNFEVTKMCIDYLLQLDEIENHQIVVVDNNSENNSCEDLMLIFNKYTNIHFIISTENLGFAKGNNLGYVYSKENFECDFIVVMNNDIFIKQKKFIKFLLKDDNTDFHVIGPQIIEMSGKNQNPLRKKILSNNQLIKIFIYNKFLSVIFKIPFINRVFLLILEFVKRNKNRSTSRHLQNPLESEHEVLHGSCLIFSKKWIKNEKYAFLPVTFMYFEEDILAEYIKFKNYTSKTDFNLKVYHLEDSSLNATFSKNIEKRLFLAENMSSSIRKLIKLRKTGEYNS